MKQIIFFLFAVFATLISCNKKNEVFQIEGKYVSATTGNLTPVMMYTMQGQVTNAATIKDYIHSKGIADGFKFDNSSLAIEPYLLSFTIGKDSMATVATKLSPTPKPFEIVDRTSSQFVLASMDSTQIFIFSGGANYSNSRCSTIDKAMINMKTSSTFYPLSSSTGYAGYYLFRQVFPIEINNGKLYLPIMVKMVSSSSAYGSCRTYTPGIYNSFNKNSIAQLQAGDTIMYQINKVELVRQ